MIIMGQFSIFLHKNDGKAIQCLHKNMLWGFFWIASARRFYWVPTCLHGKLKNIIFSSSNFHLIYFHNHTDMGLVMRKTVFGICDQVRLNQTVQPQKLARALKFWIYKLEILYYLGSEQQRLLAYRIKQVFSWHGSYVNHDQTESYWSLQAPFHSASLPQGFLTRTMGILPLTLGVWISTWKHNCQVFLSRGKHIIPLSFWAEFYGPLRLFH